MRFFLIIKRAAISSRGVHARWRGRWPHALYALIALALVAAPSSFAAANVNPSQAKSMITDLTKQAITILKTEKGNLAERENKFRTILAKYFAMHSISRTVAGQHWREMSPKQKADFQKLFSEWVLKTYARRFGGYTGEDISVGDAAAVGHDSVLVQTTVKGPSRSNKVAWRVRQGGEERNKIVDVSVDGVSMLVTQRSEIASIVKSKGVDGMLRTLRSHVQKAAASH